MLILWKEFSSFPLSHGTMIRKLLSPIIAFLYQDNSLRAGSQRNRRAKRAEKGLRRQRFHAAVPKHPPCTRFWCNLWLVRLLIVDGSYWHLDFADAMRRDTIKICISAQPSVNMMVSSGSERVTDDSLRDFVHIWQLKEEQKRCLRSLA